MHAIRASARYGRAIHATAELLAKLKIDAIFVGRVAHAAWLGSEVDAGAIDALALMNAPQKNQLAMMAANRGFRVEREEIEQSEELDLVPINFIDAEGDVRVHVLLASNALYGRMVASGVDAVFEDRPLRVPAVEDLALMLLMGDDEESVRSLVALPQFDRRVWQERMVSIGLSGLVDSE